MLTQVGFPIERSAAEAWPDFRGWRINYESVAYRLCDRLTAPPAPWSGTRRHLRSGPVAPRRPPQRAPGKLAGAPPGGGGAAHRRVTGVAPGHPDPDGRTRPIRRRAGNSSASSADARVRCDDARRHVGELGIVVPGQRVQPHERIVGIDVGQLRDDAFGLLDGDPAVQRALQLDRSAAASSPPPGSGAGSAWPRGPGPGRPPHRPGPVAGARP